MRILGQIELQVNLNGLVVPHLFIVLPSLFHESILGTDFLLKTQAKLDFCHHIISFYDDLTALPLLPLQASDCILRLSQHVTIPPATEGLVPVIVPRGNRPQLSIIEPLSTIGW